MTDPKRMPAFRPLTLACAALFASGAFAQAPVEERRGPDAVDRESTRALREYTTDPAFLTEWVDYVPESASVPSPRDFLGYVVGTPGRLTQPDRIVAYFRELERTSERVRVLPMGLSHGGREMVVAAVADAGVLARMDAIAAANHRLADPRRTSRADARVIADSTPVTYYMTAGLHSPETGPPEMVMELAYRLAVSDQPHVQEIRANVLTLITPVLEMDGRARQVDWYYRHLTEVTDLDDTPPRSPPYWGDYTFHDNNRDGLQVSQPLTRNYTEAFHRFLPTVSLDLHESVPLLYVSMGTGPYNETIDPITITEWQWLAAYDVTQATRLGLRGVWTWGFYTGWYPGYLLWVTNNHNAVGRFYETFGNSLAGTFERDLKAASYADDLVRSRQWYRAWPPERKFDWSLRNNTNYMQTGVLASLSLAARNGDTLLMNFWQKGFNSLAKGRSEAPFAFHIPRAQREKGRLAYLLWLLDKHRIEVHEARAEVAVSEDETIAAGDFVVRMNQPYRNFAKTLFTKQDFPKNAAHRPYDDISWNLPHMLGLRVNPIDDAAILQAQLALVETVPALAGEVAGGGPWIVDHRGQATLAGLRWALADVDVAALAEEWEGHPAGSLVVSGIDTDRANELAREHHADFQPLPAGEPPTIDANPPRVALYHTWTYTQDSGWARYALEELGIPYTLVDKDDVRAGDLGGRFDAIVVPNTRASLQAIVHGIDEKWGPMPYTQTDEFPSHGVIDSSPDITGGMGFAGLAELERFVKGGGLLVTLANAGLLAADSGLAREVSSLPSAGTPGSHVTAKVLRPEHPVTFGYDEVTHVFRGNARRFAVREHWQGMVVAQYGTQTLAEAEREADEKAGIPVPEPETAETAEGDAGAPEAAEKPPPLCLSGLVADPSALLRMPAILDVPVGDGRVLLFTWNPLHRYQNHHDFGFLANALLFHDDFPGTPSKKEMRERERR